MYPGSCFFWLLSRYQIPRCLVMLVESWQLCYLGFVDLDTFFCFYCRSISGLLSLKSNILLTFIGLIRILLIIKLVWIRKSLGVNGCLGLLTFWDGFSQRWGVRGGQMVRIWVRLILSRRNKVCSLWEGFKGRWELTETDLMKRIKEVLLQNKVFFKSWNLFYELIIEIKVLRLLTIHKYFNNNCVSCQ